MTTEERERRKRVEDLAKNDPAAFLAAKARLKPRRFKPHGGGQQKILDSQARFRTLAAGRRWGKTMVAAHEIVKRANKPNQVIWWIANTYKNTSRGYKEVVKQLPSSWLAKPAPSYTSTNKILQLKNGTVIEFYSGGSPDSLAGEGVDFVVVDEAALIPDNVWQQLIRPTLMDTGGEAFIISTPRGHNWFWTMYKLGQEGNPEYASWQMPQTANPYIPQSETDSAEAELPKIIFEQEIMAKFLAAGASIFGVGLERDDVMFDNIVEPLGEVFVGIDLAKQNDFTVITADRADGLPCYFERFNQIDWPTQEARIVYAIAELEDTPGVDSVTTMIDSTGLGDVVYDHLSAAGVDLTPINFNNQSKEQMARLLAADMEQGRARLLDDMKEEFESYEFKLTPSGKYQFEAASGGHDDMVAAKMLAHWGRIHEGAPEISIVSIEREEVHPEARLREQLLAPAAVPIVEDDVSDMLQRPDIWSGGFAGSGGRGRFFSS